eukprot:COSAG01_NODE_27372_length_687_cov_1.491497_2_plen_97_part_01
MAACPANTATSMATVSVAATLPRTLAMPLTALAAATRFCHNAHPTSKIAMRHHHRRRHTVVRMASIGLAARATHAKLGGTNPRARTLPRVAVTARAV